MSFVLGLDLDGVTSNYTEGLARVVEEDRGLAEGTLPQPTSWDFGNWGLDRDDFMRHHIELVVHRNGYRTLEAMDGASDALWRLSDAGVWIRIITHRLMVSKQHAIIASDTVAWLEEAGIPYRDICFLGAKTDTAADVYVDDAPHNLKALRGAGQKAIVFDQPYNRGVEGPRAHNWMELESMILEEKARCS